jgi:phytoene/squalene synthetase
MSLDACAALVEKGDPDRFLAVMAAPPAARERLLPLYAFNLEVARAPWVTEQPLIAEMRLQFWRDVLVAPKPRAHEVAGPLHQVVAASGLDRDVLDRLILARHWDIHRDPHADAAAFDAYIEATAAGLMWSAGEALGARRDAEQGLRALGWASGLANYLRAVPDLEARGRIPLPDERPETVRALARKGLRKLAEARGARQGFGVGAPAGLAAWMAGPLLAQAAAEPDRVAQGALGLSEFSRRSRLLWTATTGRF